MTTRYFTDGSPMDVPSNTGVNDTFTMGITGMTTNPTGTASYQKIGNIVLLSIPELSGLSNSVNFTLTGLPAGIRPSVTRNVTAIEVTSAGLTARGSATINTDGTITLFAGNLGAAFSALLGKSVSKQEIPYLV